MRKRDILFVCVAFGGVLAGLVWAFNTQSRWVQENRAPQVPQGPPSAVVPGPPATPATGVIGTVTDDTRTALAKRLGSPRPPRQAVPAGRRAPGTAAAAAPEPRGLRSPATPGRVSTQP